MIECPGCINEAAAAKEARVIAEGWRRTAIRCGYRDDTVAGTVDPTLAEADIRDDFYTARRWEDPINGLYTIQLTKREMDVAREFIAYAVTIPSTHQDYETAESVIAELEAAGAEGSL